MLKDKLQKTEFISVIKPAVLVSVILVVICGLLYPLFVMGIGTLLFPRQAKGNFITIDGTAIGSELVGQAFSQPYFMKGRPSAVNYNTYELGEEETLGSGSSNYGASNPALAERIRNDIETLRKLNPEISVDEIPVDLVTQSGSGLDPHVSLAGALYQVPVIARNSGLSEEMVKEIIEKNTEHKVLGIFGEEKVNVLKVNLDIACAMDLISGYQLP